ncbi:MAG TPA: hypothetical protein VKY15_07825, partial [Acidimicrobiales bacterium]|nr:hypothetical protein [Acidimicrobiales bacterium]
TNLCTAAALMTWVVWDMMSSRRKSSLVGAVNGMIVGLVAITPAAGFVNGVGAILMGIIASSVVWCTMNLLGDKGIFKRVDDALGVVHTHGFAGLCGGLLVGLFADPAVIEYAGSGKVASFSVKGLFYGHPWQFMLQLFAALTIIAWDGVVTFLILKLISLFVPLRMTEEEMLAGDSAVHGEILAAEQLPEPVQPEPEPPLGPHQRVPVGVGDGAGLQAPTMPQSSSMARTEPPPTG